MNVFFILKRTWTNSQLNKCSLTLAVLFLTQFKEFYCVIKDTENDNNQKQEF